MPTISFQLSNLQSSVSITSQKFNAENIINRFWKKDHTIWRTEEEHKKSILNRLGWQDSIHLMKENIQSLTSFAEEIKRDGFTHAVVLGMGGSSLCPDVCRATFGSTEGFPHLLVLDSTNPTSVIRVEHQVNLATTLFIVASKSGGTTETNMFYQYFYDRVGKVKSNAGDNFIAVTDADTKMEKIALEKKFRKIFINPQDIGGRYSALSYFGLVPMVLIGMDCKRILDSADQMRDICKNGIGENPAVMIGIAMGEAYAAGRDKLTFISSDEISTFGFWAEQLIAESTGKEGKGIVPIEGERFDGDKYSSDRFFVFLQLAKDRNAFKALQQKLSDAKHPFVVVEMNDPYELGSQFFLWEIATAFSAVALSINPFDEPNVKESKDNTVRVITEYQKNGKLPSIPEFQHDSQFIFVAEKEYAESIKHSALKETLAAHLRGKSGYDYIGILAYIDQTKLHAEILYRMREKVTEQFKIVSTIGFGPRYLHSTGQLHKGGRANGIFLIITGDEPHDLNIPGEVFTFEVLKNAQALGDYQSFAARKSRVLHIHIKGNIDAGLENLVQMVS